MKALAIARINLTRTLRERTSIFFIFLFPMLLILILGVSFGGEFEPRVGVVAGEKGGAAADLVDRLSSTEGIVVQRFDDRRSMSDAVARAELEAGVSLPARYDARLISGGDVRVAYLARPGLAGQQIRSLVDAAIADQAKVFRAARFVEQELAIPADELMPVVRGIAMGLPQTEVRLVDVGEATFPTSLGRFDMGASAQLMLFVFLTSMTGAAALIETRRLGVSRRMMATPTSPRTIIVGEALGRFAVGALQGVFIMLGSSLVFGVSWGDPVSAAILMLTFALVASGCGMLIGVLVSNAQQAVAIGLLVGLGLGALGGGMMPLEFFSDTMRSVAHATPHAWASDGFAELVREGAGLMEVLGEITILGAMALVAFTLASNRLRKVLTH